MLELPPTAIVPPAEESPAPLFEPLVAFVAGEPALHPATNNVTTAIVLKQRMAPWWLQPALRSSHLGTLVSGMFTSARRPRARPARASHFRAAFDWRSAAAGRGPRPRP